MPPAPHQPAKTLIVNVTVLMPVYNGARFLREAIDSVLIQTHREFELLVIDDGSTDGSSAALSVYEAEDRRVRVIRKTNSGIAESLNLGLREAKGRWIVRMDCDDIMIPTRISRQLAFMQANPELSFAGSHFDEINEAGTRLRTNRHGPTSLPALRKCLAGRETITFTHPTVIMDRRAAIDAGSYRREAQPNEDLDLFGRMLTRGYWGCIQPEVLLQYRVHPQSLSSINVMEQIETREFILFNVHRRLQGEPELTFPDYRAASGRGLIANLLRRRKIYVEALVRRAFLEQAGGRLASRAMMLLLASLISPDKAARRALTLLRGLRARKG